jgi:hypothetical protein
MVPNPYQNVTDPQHCLPSQGSSVLGAFGEQKNIPPLSYANICVGVRAGDRRSCGRGQPAEYPDSAISGRQVQLHLRTLLSTATGKFSYSSPLHAI